VWESPGEHGREVEVVAIFTKAIFPTDFSEASEKVLIFATGLKGFGLEEIVLVNVLDTRGLESPVVAQKERMTRARMEKMAEDISAYGVRVVPKLLFGTSPHDAILEAAYREEAQLIVTGSRGKSAIDEVLLGSVSEQVGRESELPVLIVRYGLVEDREPEELIAEAESICSKVLHPTDFSPYSNRALQLVRELKGECEERKKPWNQVLVLHVVDGDLDEEKKELVKRDARGKLKKVFNRLEKAGVNCDTKLVVGDPVAETLRIAGEECASMIALGSHGKGIVSETIVGSVSQNVIRMANKPVLVTH